MNDKLLFAAVLRIAANYCFHSSITFMVTMVMRLYTLYGRNFTEVNHSKLILLHAMTFLSLDFAFFFFCHVFSSYYKYQYIYSMYWYLNTFCFFNLSPSRFLLNACMALHSGGFRFPPKETLSVFPDGQQAHNFVV